MLPNRATAVQTSRPSHGVTSPIPSQYHHHHPPPPPLRAAATAAVEPPGECPPLGPNRGELVDPAGAQQRHIMAPKCLQQCPPLMPSKKAAKSATSPAPDTSRHPLDAPSKSPANATSPAPNAVEKSREQHHLTASRRHVTGPQRPQRRSPATPPHRLERHVAR